jgi:2',3'-cyclic-nucleotide 2'-phosphodiesterase (5'-nucleotidase family)
MTRELKLHQYLLLLCFASVLVVRHTMKASPLRSMHKTHLVRAALLTFALAFAAASIQAQQAAPSQAPRASEILVDQSIPDDPDVMKLLEPYRKKVVELETEIGRLEGELSKPRQAVGAGSLGNFVTDGVRWEANGKLKTHAVLAVSNAGGLRRTTIPEGVLKVRDIWELLPFENSLIVLDLTGAQVENLLRAVTTIGDAQSGARVIYRQNDAGKREFISASLIDANGKETKIDPNAVYPIVTIDYLWNLKSGSYAILREGKNMRPLGITLRDAIIDYVKTMKVVRPVSDDRFVQVVTHGQL